MPYPRRLETRAPSGIRVAGRLPTKPARAMWRTTEAARYQVFARTTASGRRTRTRASTATQRSGSASTGLRSSSATSGRSSPSRARRWTRSTSAARSAGGRAAEARHEPARLAAVDELLGVDVRQRRDPERRLADQLGEDAAGAEGDERAEDRILDDARRAARRRPRASAGRSRAARCARPRRATASVVVEVERDAAGLRLVRAGRGGLDDGREAELARRRDRLVGVAATRSRNERDAVRERAARGSRPGRATRRRRAPSASVDDRCAPRVSMPSSVGTRAVRAPQPLRALGGAAERARGGLRIGERGDVRDRAERRRGPRPTVMIDREHGLVGPAARRPRRCDRLGDLVRRRADGRHEEDDHGVDARVGEQERAAPLRTARARRASRACRPGSRRSPRPAASAASAVARLVAERAAARARPPRRRRRRGSRARRRS